MFQYEVDTCMFCEVDTCISERLTRGIILTLAMTWQCVNDDVFSS